MTRNKEVDMLRRLTSQYLDVCANPLQQQKRVLWRKHFDRQGERPMVCIRPYCMGDTLYKYLNIECESPLFRDQEATLKQKLFMQSWGEDTVPYPWLDLNASLDKSATVDYWGFSLNHETVAGGGKNVYHNVPLKTLEDIAKIRPPQLLYDEEKTAMDFEELQKAVGDIIPIHIQRSPYRLFASEIICFLRGMEQVMFDMYDNPGFLKDLVKIVTDAELEQYREADKNNFWRSADQFNYTGSLDCDDTASPEPNKPCAQGEAWGTFHAQEFTMVSPDMLNEFILHYEVPLMKQYKYISYGCCEDLTNKISLLKKTIPNLHTIGIAPAANLESCATQIQNDFVISWRPNPAEVLSCNFDEKYIVEYISKRLSILKENTCTVEISLKDIVTVQNDMSRFSRWTEIVKKSIEKIWS